MEGFKGVGPTPDEVHSRYYSNPTLGYAMMAQALLMSEIWHKNLEEMDVAARQA